MDGCKAGRPVQRVYLSLRLRPLLLDLLIGDLDPRVEKDGMRRMGARGWKLRRRERWCSSWLGVTEEWGGGVVMGCGIVKRLGGSQSVQIRHLIGSPISGVENIEPRSAQCEAR